jgi:uncharacterized protein YbgA (DUF1722 family)
LIWDLAYVSHIREASSLLFKEEFSEKLSSPKNALFFDWIQKYMEGKTSLCPVINTIRSWIVSFKDQCLLIRPFLNPVQKV